MGRRKPAARMSRGRSSSSLDRENNLPSPIPIVCTRYCSSKFWASISQSLALWPHLLEATLDAHFKSRYGMMVRPMFAPSHLQEIGLVRGRVHKPASFLFVKEEDSFQRGSRDKKDEHHGSVYERIRSRLHLLFEKYNNGKFPDISKPGFVYSVLPCQVMQNDCMIFGLLYIEHYKGESQQLDINIVPAQGIEYRA